jgi:hypothetical protein
MKTSWRATGHRATFVPFPVATSATRMKLGTFPPSMVTIRVPSGEVPPLPEREEGVLHQFLRVVLASGDEVQRSVQAIVVVEEELIEAQRFPRSLPSPTQLDSDPLSLHAPMDARGGRFV